MLNTTERNACDVKIRLLTLMVMVIGLLGIIIYFNLSKAKASENHFTIYHPKVTAKQDDITDWNKALVAINEVKNDISNVRNEPKMTYSKAATRLEATFNRIHNIFESKTVNLLNSGCLDLHQTSHYAEDAWYEVRVKLGDKDDSQLTKETKNDLQSILNNLSGQVNCLKKELKCLSNKKVADKKKCYKPKPTVNTN